MPLGLLPRSGKLWLRNGLGQLVKAKADRKFGDLKVALVRLDSPLPVPEELLIAAGEAFPGSPGFAVEYVSTPDPAPAWPVLRIGFLGGVKGHSDERFLGIDMPAGPRGGPIFDGYGRLIDPAVQVRREHLMQLHQATTRWCRCCSFAKPSVVQSPASS